MKIGKFELFTINSGFFSLDGGAMFGVIPRPLWERTNPPDSRNRIRLATRSLLLKSPSANILIDNGMGNKSDEKSKDIYNIDQDNYSLEKSLAGIGLHKEDITAVILTHLHFDHCGGSTEYDNGRLVPAFPNAKYYVSRKNYDWAVEATERDKASYLKENFVPLAEEGVLTFLNGNTFDDGIELIEMNGHTFGMNLVKISDSSNTLLYCADLLPCRAHVPLPYIMGYDLQPLVTLDEKKKILSAAADEGWILFFEHDPDTAAARTVRTEKGFKADALTEIV